MKKDTDGQLEFKFKGCRRIEAVFDEPEVTGDFGAVLMRAVEEKEKIVETLAGKIEDERHKSYVEHGLREMLMQRVFQTACGYEDADDCDHMRKDAAFKAAVRGGPSKGAELASQPTMTRLENAVSVRDLLRIAYGFIDHFMDSYAKEPRLIRRIRSRWRNVIIVFRADSHHTKPEVMDFLDSNGIEYVNGLGPNAVLDSMRSNALDGTGPGDAQFDTIRLRLLKVGARVEAMKRKIRFHRIADMPGPAPAPASG